MRQVVIVATLLAALLGVAGTPRPAAAGRGIISTRFACERSCGIAVTDACGGLTKRGKFRACRNRLYRQCRRWGTDVMCPTPVASTTTTTVPDPALLTTTTVPGPPATTSTVPSVYSTTTSTTLYRSPTPTTTMPSYPTTSTTVFTTTSTTVFPTTSTTIPFWVGTHLDLRGTWRFVGCTHVGYAIPGWNQQVNVTFKITDEWDENANSNPPRPPVLKFSGQFSDDPGFSPASGLIVANAVTPSTNAEWNLKQQLPNLPGIDSELSGR